MSRGKVAWDQVLPQILFVYRFCPHTSTGESSYTLVHGGEPVLSIHKMIKVTTPYPGESSLGNGYPLQKRKKCKIYKTLKKGKIYKTKNIERYLKIILQF